MLRNSLAFLAALLFALPAFAKVAAGQDAPPLSLANANDSTFSTTHPRTTPLVLAFTTRDLGDYSLAWHDSIHAHVEGVKIQSVLDLSDVSSWLHGLARIRIKAKGSKAVIDWDGEASKAWRGEDRSKVVMVGISTDNVIRFVIPGTPTAENLAKAVQALREMAGAECPE